MHLEDISKIIDSDEKDIIDFARNLVKTNSENPPGDESGVAEIIINKALDWGLSEPLIWQKKEKRPNLIFTFGDQNNGKNLILQAHTDTKPIGDKSKWHINPAEPAILNGKLYGRGSTDMKGAVTAMLASVMAIIRAGIELKGRITIVLSADEEAGSIFGAKVLVENGLKGDAILITEPSGVNEDFDSLGLACRGALLGKVVVYGTQMHSSISDRGGCINASVKMAQVLLEFNKNLKQYLYYSPHYLYPEGPTINPGVMVNGGIFYGVIPGEASFGFDIRTIPGMKNEKLVREIKNFLADLMKNDKDLKAELVLEKPPLDNLLPAEIDKNHPLVHSCVTVTKQVLGREPKLLGVPFSTDAIYLANELNIPTIPSFGPGLIKLAHAPDEYIEIKSVIEAAKIFAGVSINYLNEI